MTCRTKVAEPSVHDRRFFVILHFMKPDQNVLRQFDIKGEIEFLPGGEGRTYRVGNTVLKHIGKDTEEYTNWISGLFAGIEERGFRISKPVADTKGKWITEDGWTAWTFLEGDSDSTARIPESIESITAFHQAVKNVTKPGFLDTLDDPYAKRISIRC